MKNSPKDPFNAMMFSYVPKVNKCVILLSTQHQDMIISNSAKKPEAILDYNHCKGAVDTMDRIFAEYSCQRSTKRWPLAVFFNLINMSWNNDFILFTAKYP
jgi:hypothetical protein